MNYKNLSTAGVIFLVIASLFLFAETVGAVKNWNYSDSTKDSRAEISVNGTGDVLVVPDTATFTYTVTGEAKTVQDAQTQATTLGNKALDYLKQQNIADADIKTISYDINPKYEYQQSSSQAVCINCGGKQVLVGYQVTQSVEVKVHDTSKAGTILAGIGGLGVQNVSGLSLTVNDPMSVQRQAREKAIADAKSKAEALAKDLGVHLVRITSYQEQGQNPIVYDRAVPMSAALGSAPVPSIPTGQNKVTSDVTITYEIR